MIAMIAMIVSLIYWGGFFIAYVTFKPYDNSWRGWIIDLLLSIVWFITLPLHCITRK